MFSGKVHRPVIINEAKTDPPPPLRHETLKQGLVFRAWRAPECRNTILKPTTPSLNPKPKLQPEPEAEEYTASPRRSRASITSGEDKPSLTVTATLATSQVPASQP